VTHSYVLNMGYKQDRLFLVHIQIRMALLSLEVLTQNV